MIGQREKARRGSRGRGAGWRGWWSAAAVLVAGGGMVSMAQGGIDLRFEPEVPVVNVGETVRVRLVATPTAPGVTGIQALQTVFAWDVARLRLTGWTDSAAAPFTARGFFADGSGVNEAAVPADGSAMFVLLGPLGPAGIPLPTSGGLLVTTLNFQALAPTLPGMTVIDLRSSFGETALARTVVFGAPGPNNDVTGQLTAAAVTIIPGPATAVVGLLAVGVAGRRGRRATT